MHVVAKQVNYRDLTDQLLETSIEAMILHINVRDTYIFDFFALKKHERNIKLLKKHTMCDVIHTCDSAVGDCRAPTSIYNQYKTIKRVHVITFTYLFMYKFDTGYKSNKIVVLYVFFIS